MPASQALHFNIDVFTGTPAAVEWKRPTDNPWKTWLQQVEEKTRVYLSVPVSSQA